MKAHVIVLLSGCLLLSACKRRKVEFPPTPEAPPATAAEQKAPSPAPVASPAGASAGPQNVAQFEAGVEYSDLNNTIAGFEFRNKRLPTMEELQRAYYGGKRPIQAPPGYTLVIDPQSKKVKAVPSR